MEEHRTPAAWTSTLAPWMLVSLALVQVAAPNPSPLAGSNWGSPRRYVHLQTSTELSNFYLEIKLDGTVRKTPSRGPYSTWAFTHARFTHLSCVHTVACWVFAGVVTLKADTRERLAILGVKSSRYLCMDLDGTPFTSSVCLRDDCLFDHKLLENNRDVFYSSRTGILFNLEGSRQVFSAGLNLPQTSLFLPKKSTVPLERLLLHREKRNRLPDVVEASDSRAEPELEQEAEVGDEGRNASWEILPDPPAPHDPWSVHSANPASPRSTGTVG
ncbi:fibroblast growth factor 23 isoform X1 [Entelurus aequoreus]|uniref:fibroblast growth factor 23 isoform X1 n=1 Tax=Entelurus aequoreus TaxID=161455 RepID=UPI002B1DB2CE|nr:fibroblast growth factor 23 isoform X1 [Entelurus aequoreus]